MRCVCRESQSIVVTWGKIWFLALPGWLSFRKKTYMQPQWLDKSEYPFAPEYFSINGNKLHYIDEGQGETILYVHGTPSWSFDFRNIIRKLKNEYRCIAVDHIGFGLSSKPGQ